MKSKSIIGIPSRKYRPELHGIRGIALLGVVLFHLFGNGRVSGGIDIFLAITGFLFVGMLLRETSENDGRVNLHKYFGRLFRRIFVPAAIVILASAVVAFFVLPSTQIRQTFAEARAALLYFENFELIYSRLAYGAAGPDASLYQHFWSLSVQGQFYLVLPFLFLILGLIFRKTSLRTHLNLTAILLVLVLVVSLGWATYQGSYAQDEAYLSTWTRLWQFAFGGLLALVLDRVRAEGVTRFAAGWLGLALVVSCGFVLEGGALFPGPFALWPLVGWVLVMIAGDLSGTRFHRFSTSRLFEARPVVWFADRSYGIYLWHWPVLIFYLTLRERDAVGVKGAAVILAITVALASVMYWAVERPLSPQSTSRLGGLFKKNTVMLPVGVATMLVGTLALTPFTVVRGELETSYQDLDPEKYPGAEIVLWEDDQELPVADPFPHPDNVDEYKAPYWYRGCSQKFGEKPGTDEVKICDDEDAPENPTARIVLAGGSFAGHWELAFKSLARKYGWEVIVIDKGGCTFGSEKSVEDSVCGRYNANIVKWLNQNDIDLVVTSGSRTDETHDEEYIFENAPYWWDQITDTGADLMLMRAVARDRTLDVPACIADGGSPQECGPDKKWSAKSPLASLELPRGAHELDMSSYTCPAIEDPNLSNCDAVVGNILITYDNGHLSAPFAESLAKALEKEMKKDFEWLLR